MADQRFGQRRPVRRGDRLIAAVRAQSAGARDPVVDGGQVDHADRRAVVDEQRHQRREERDAARKGDGAVDRVDHPAAPGVPARRVAELLAQDRVVREGLGDRFTDRPLGGAIGLGDRRAVALGLDRHVPEARQDLRAGAVAGALRDVERVAKRRVGQVDGLRLGPCEAELRERAHASGAGPGASSMGPSSPASDRPRRRSKG